MSNKYDYMKLPVDLSGSMEKNRFRNEILWGLKKIYELHKSDSEYINYTYKESNQNANY